MSALWLLGLGSENADLNFCIWIWPFWACLAIHYATFGIKPLNLLVNSDTNVWILIISLSGIKLAIWRSWKLTAYVHCTYPDNDILLLLLCCPMLSELQNKATCKELFCCGWYPLNFCNIFTLLKTRVLDCLNCHLVKLHHSRSFCWNFTTWQIDRQEHIPISTLSTTDVW